MLHKLFGFDSKTMNLKTEIIGGITTFLTMAYILAVNPEIMSASGMDKNALFTSTIIAALIGTLAMSLLAKLPFALAPAMGLNAFFAFTICGEMGHPWQFALSAVLIEGIIFILLTVTNVREAIVNAIPTTLKNAIGAGIGLFIAFIGLQNSGIIVSNPTTFVSLGDITQVPILLTFLGIIVTAVLLIKKIRGALLIGILITSAIGIPFGITHIDGVLSTPPSIEPIFFKFDTSAIFTADMAVVVMTMLFIDMFDTIGTLVGVCTKSGMMKDGKIPNGKRALLADAIATTTGAMVGSCTTSTFVESAAGIAEGGRSGLTSFVTALCFIVALFFAPLFLSIPAAATAPALVLVGLMMMTPILHIDLVDYSESLPAFICMIMMPLAYSISDGILLGVISYVIINLLSGKFDKLKISTYALAVIFIFKYVI